MKSNKFLLLLLTGLLCGAPFWLNAQEVLTQEEYLRRYNNLVQRVGIAGVGVETLLNKWETTYPQDANLQLARFSFCFERSRTPQIIQLDKDRYLGQEPLLPMTDSLGKVCNYFQDYVYDDDLVAEALSSLDKAISSFPDRLDYRLLKADALVAYEKGSPEMATQALKDMIDRHYTRHPAWEYDGLESVSPDQFKAFVQDECAVIFRQGTDSSAEAFRMVSEHVLSYEKDEPLFLDNLGGYYLVKKDFKKARKYFDQVLKKHPDDQTAIRNSLLLARSTKDVKLQKKCLELMARYGATEQDRASARVQLEAMGVK